MSHGISTSIVEIDPAVYDAAVKYFGLAVTDSETVSIMEARSWIVQKGKELADTVAEAEHELFDYVIHDCFSGGSVPGHMFTKPFWEELSKIVKREGVVAVVRSSSVSLFASERSVDHDHRTSPESSALIP